VSGAPQLGAGAAIGTAAGAGAGAVAGASLAGATTRIAGGIGKSATHAAARIAGGGMSSFSLAKAASGQTGIRGMASGVSGMAKAGAGSVKQGTLSRLSATKAGMSSHLEAGARTAFTATGGTGVSAIPISGAPSAGQPNWARKIQTSQTRRDASLAAAAAVRDGDRPGSGASPKFRDGEEQ
ncbi:MAG: P-type conjugative transfer protein TrbL, partial [Pseudomonadota bacterium]